MKLDPNFIYLIIAILGFLLSIGIIAVYMNKILNVAKETKEALSAFISMFDPAGPGGDKPTNDEITNFWKELKDIAQAIKDFKKK